MRRTVVGVLLGLGAAVIVLGLAAAGVFEELELNLYDWRMRTVAEEAPDVSRDIVIIELNDTTQAARLEAEPYRLGPGIYERQTITTPFPKLSETRKQLAPSGGNMGPFSDPSPARTGPISAADWGVSPRQTRR